MIIWVDAQLPPAIAAWIRQTFGIEAASVRDLGLRDSEDLEIFDAAKNAVAVVMTKDVDFVDLVRHYGPPPQVLWIKCGNTSNARLKEILLVTFSDASRLLESGEPFVEIRDA